MERIVIKTQNLPIIENQIHLFKAKFGQALKKAPSDASLCCCLLRENEVYIVNLRVHSATGHFPVQITGIAISECVEKAIVELQSLFKEWHEDPKLFAKSHEMGKAPCVNTHGKVLRCPLESFANKRFEKSFRKTGTS